MSTQHQNQNQKQQSKSLLSRLRTAVQKVRLLLSSTILSHTWRAASMIRRASLSNRHISFNDRTGLKICCSDETGTEGSGSPSPPPLTPPSGLHRTISFPSDDDDIDRRAEIFIANFRKQLKMERQISLQLRYRREHTSELISP